MCNCADNSIASNYAWSGGDGVGGHSEGLPVGPVVVSGRVKVLPCDGASRNHGLLSCAQGGLVDGSGEDMLSLPFFSIDYPFFLPHLGSVYSGVGHFLFIFAIFVGK